MAKAKKMNRSECEQLLIDAGYPMTGKDRIIYVQQEKGFLRVSVLWPHKRHYEDDLRKELRALFARLRYGVQVEAYDEDGNMIRDADGNQVMEVIEPGRDLGQPVQVDYKIGPDKYSPTVPANMAGHDCAGETWTDWSVASAAERQLMLVK